MLLSRASSKVLGTIFQRGNCIPHIRIAHPDNFNVIQACSSLLLWRVWHQTFPTRDGHDGRGRGGRDGRDGHDGPEERV